MDDQRQGTRYGLAELADAAGVSIRTVRYYIAEGLLPPPEGAGPRSAYTAGHLDRLRLIGRLKDAYLPLREIRRRLDGLDDPAVRALLRQLGPGSGGRGRDDGEEQSASSQPPDSAADYLDRVMGRRPAAQPPIVRATARLPSTPSAEGFARPAPPVGKQPAAPEEAHETDADASGQPEPIWWGEQQDAGRFEATLLEQDPAAFADAPLHDLDLDPALALAPPPETGATPDGPWRRLSLGPDAELLIREDAYLRRRDRVDWLVGWARKVFGG